MVQGKIMMCEASFFAVPASSDATALDIIYQLVVGYHTMGSRLELTKEQCRVEARRHKSIKEIEPNYRWETCPLHLRPREQSHYIPDATRCTRNCILCVLRIKNESRACARKSVRNGAWAQCFCRELRVYGCRGGVVVMLWVEGVALCQGLRRNILVKWWYSYNNTLYSHHAQCYFRFWIREGFNYELDWMKKNNVSGRMMIMTWSINNAAHPHSNAHLDRATPLLLFYFQQKVGCWFRITINACLACCLPRSMEWALGWALERAAVCRYRPFRSFPLQWHRWHFRWHPHCCHQQ